MNYYLDHLDASGGRLNLISAFNKMDYVRTENTVGALKVTLPMGKWRYEDFSVNQMLEVWREKNGVTTLQNETAYFLQDWLFYTDMGGRHLIDLYAKDANCLLDSRIVGYAALAQTEMTDAADDMIKAIVKDNLGTDAVAARQLPRFTIAADLSAAGSLTKEFAWRNLLTTCEELAEAATEAGIRTYFDVVRTNQATFELRTYTGQRGNDHGRTSGDVRLVGEIYGNLEEASFGTYHGEETNYVYAGGQGEGVSRTIIEVSDASRISKGYPYNRKEVFGDARNGNTSALITAEANGVLGKGKPKQILTGKVVDTSGMQYGVHYGFGDILSVEAFGMAVDCHVSSVGCTVDANAYETIDVRLRGEM